MRPEFAACYAAASRTVGAAALLRVSHSLRSVQPVPQPAAGTKSVSHGPATATDFCVELVASGRSWRHALRLQSLQGLAVTGLPFDTAVG